MSDGDSITINVSGGQQNQVAGKIENRDSHIGDIINSGELTAAMFFEAIEAETKKLPEVQQQEIKDAIEPLKEIAKAESAKPVEQSTLSKYLDKLRANAPFLVKCLAAFSQPVLTKLAATDPTGVIDGVIAVVKQVQSAN